MGTLSRVRITPAPPYEQLAPVTACATVRPAASRAATPLAGRSADRSGPSLVSPLASRQPAAPPGAVAPATAQARRFAAETATVIIEVLDRRRNVAQLRRRVTAPVLDQFTALVRSTPIRGVEQVGMVRRVHIQMCGSGAAEVFGSYARGGRVRAFVCRVEWLPARVRIPPGRYESAGEGTEYRWQVVDFAII